MTQQPETPLVDETQDTTGATGSPTPADDTPGSYDAGVQETTASGAGPVDDPSNSYLVATLDTSATAGGAAAFFQQPDKHDYSMRAVEDGTLSTLEPGSPTHHADPAYRPASLPTPASVKDTTLTDHPISDGSEPDQTRLWQTENLDTVNFVSRPVASDLLPVAPATPTVASGARGALVTVAQVADPVGAPVTAYRVESIMGDPGTDPEDIEDHSPGVDWAPRNPLGPDTSVFVANLNPDLPDIYSPDGTSIPGGYRFRVAAVNANGTGPYSPWSAKVQAYNPDEHSALLPPGMPAEYQINPIYQPDGTVRPGTGGTTGPVTALVAAPTGTAGQLNVSWGAVQWGTADDYLVRASSGQQAIVTGTNALLTGLTSGVPVTVTVTPRNANGDGIAATSGSATPL